jgi:hypothetical protein
MQKQLKVLTKAVAELVSGNMVCRFAQILTSVFLPEKKMMAKEYLGTVYKVMANYRLAPLATNLSRGGNVAACKNRT